MRFTIIVPVYNASMYLSQCLDSLCEQLFQDFEVIMVDDGSTDKSVSICQRYCAEDARFRLVSHQRNKGASAARNTGVAQASGEYLLFLDNDDWWDGDVALSIVDRALRDWNDPDILCFPLGEFYEGDAAPRKKTSRLVRDCGPSAGYRAVALALIQQGLYYSSASAKAVKREVVERHSLRFDEGLRHNEDSEWSRQLLLASDSIGWLDESFYVYRRNSAVSQSKQPDQCSVLDALVAIVERQVEDRNADVYDEAHCELASSFVSYLYVLALSYVGMLGKDAAPRCVSLLKENRWLLKCPAQKRVLYVRWCMYLVGFKATTALLGEVMRREQQRIAASN